MRKNNIIFLSILLLSSCHRALPTPEIEDGIRGKQFEIDKNINERTIDKYLNRDDVCYRDMRMLIDPANYEAIGGDSYLSGYIKGFDVTPFPLIAPLNGLPKEVGIGYQGDTLFSYVNNIYIPNYQESFSIIENLFPKDKSIFLMCGGGGYAYMMKTFLISNGWDKNKIYNVGGYWYYEGKNNIAIKYIENNEVKYNFDKVIYHNIDFTSLTKL